jgi:hypothetical protein
VFKRRNISTRNEITEFSQKSERLRYAISGDYFDAEIGFALRSACRMEWKERLSDEISHSGSK